MTRYRTIVADPPWPYRWTGDSSTPRAIQYPTMGLLEIAELPVRDLAARDAHLYLWVTPEFNRRGEGSRIVQWWGFEYVGEIVWAKPSIGMGRFPRTSHEYLLVGRRGDLPFDSRDTHSVQQWPQPSRHSQKPDAAFDLIERVSPGPYLEMFARSQRLGWDTWGNEALNHIDGALDDRDEKDIPRVPLGTRVLLGHKAQQEQPAGLPECDQGGAQ